MHNQIYFIYHREMKKEKSESEKRLIQTYVFTIIFTIICWIAILCIDIEKYFRLWITIVAIFLYWMFFCLLNGIGACNWIEYEEKLEKIKNSKYSQATKEREIHRLNMRYWKEPRDEEYKQHEVELRNLAWKILWF